MSLIAHNDYVRNPQGIWVNTAPFTQEGKNFMKNKYYCPDPPGSPAFMEYWTEQLNRCENGYTSGGVSITGHHYFYLNFIQIKVVEELGNGKVGKKKLKMPDFWDGDYNFFWSKEIARFGMSDEDIQKLQLHVSIHPKYINGGNHMIVGKSRRKGYSYKNAAILANNYNCRRGSINVVGAFDKKYLYPKGTMAMASTYLSFLNKYTAWGKAREFVDKQDHKKASYKEMLNGIPSESGYLSEIQALSFKDNPDAARGIDALEVLFEEAGVFPNLKASYLATQPGLTAGKYITGQMMIFGTGGDMEKGTVDFADMFYHPEQYSLMPFMNIWDDDASASTCGFFHPVTWNMEGHYDSNGNSNVEAAKAEEEAERDRIRKASTDSTAIQQRVQEWPFNPSEAFLTVSNNDFPVIELNARLSKVEREEIFIKRGQPVNLLRELEKNAEGKLIPKVKAIPILDGTADPIWKYKPQNSSLAGCPIIYEFPSPNPPKGLYKIGFDPYRQQQANTSVSLAAIYVYKTILRGATTRNIIVAQYVGRPYNPDDVNRIAELFAELYNTEVMYENEVTHVKTYFEKQKKLDLLAAQPDNVISANIKDSKVDRVYGIHMIEKLKDAGEKYIKQWLLEVRDYTEDGNPIYNLDTICDPGLLEELIKYNRKGNFDRVMAFMMVMFQCAEEELGKEHDSDKNKNQNVEDLLNLMNNQFKRSA